MQTVIEIARQQTITTDSLEAAISSSTVKKQFRDINDTAISKGIFGSPFVLIEDEPFWGNDRLEQVDSWLSGHPTI